MSKNKIIILAVCAVLVIGGAIAAVPLLRNRNVPVTPETQPSSIENLDDDNRIPSYNNSDVIDLNETESTLAPDGQDTTVTQQTAADGSLITKITQIISTTSRVVNPAAPTANNNSGRRNNTTTTAKKPATTKAGNNGRTTTTPGGFVQDKIGPDASQSFLGYRWSPDGYYYCDDKDCWQKGVGYNEVYDKWAPVAAMYIDQIRIKFQYNNKNYMIQLWKGQYGWLLIGAEIGIYTCDLDAYQGNTGDINHFNCADKEDWLKMQLDCYYCNSRTGNGQYTRIFTRPYDTYWWATGFVKGQLNKYTAPRTELKTRNRITFKTEDQANLFIQGLKQAGFKRAGAADQLVDDSYFQSKNDVWVLWSTINHECFVGYESTMQ